jgi:hypothetical protein
MSTDKKEKALFPSSKDLFEGLSKVASTNPFSCITKQKEDLQVKEDEKEIKDEGIREEGDYWL